MKKKLLDIFKNILDSDTIDETVSQANCEKWDSLNHLNLIVEIESEFDIAIEPEEFADMEDFAAVEKMVASKIDK